MTDAKSFLTQPNRILSDINIKREKTEALRENILPKGVSFDKERVQSAPDDKMAQYVAKLEEIEQTLKDLYEKYYKAVNEVERVIYLVNDQDAREVLAKRYMAGKSWLKIELEIGYMSVATIYRVHKRGLRAVTKILSGLENDSK